jgi:hypothetical protein
LGDAIMYILLLIKEVVCDVDIVKVEVGER